MTEEERCRILLVNIIGQAIEDAFFLRRANNKGKGRDNVIDGSNCRDKDEAIAWLKGEFATDWLEAYCDLLDEDSKHLIANMKNKLSGDHKDGYELKRKSDIAKEIGFDLRCLERDLRRKDSDCDARREDARRLCEGKGSTAGKRVKR